MYYNMATFSGFLSHFTQSSGTNDIMSNVNGPVTAYYSNGAGSSYYGGYMYIGNLLIQFTYFYPNGTSPVLPITVNSSTLMTIKFPIVFNSTPYCVLTSPFQSGNSGGGYSITVKNVTSTSFDAYTTNVSGYIQYIAIGPK
jgi:hypothetical protein